MRTLENTTRDGGSTTLYALVSVDIVYTVYTVVMVRQEFVKNFTPPDFQAKDFTPSISPNFNSFSKKKHKK